MSNQTTPKSAKFCESYPFPPCWQDDERVQVLLAPFRDRSVNAESYDAKIKFWQDTIQEYCLYKGKVIFSKQELYDTFTKGPRVPCCLDTVLDEMQRKKLIRLRKDYLYDPKDSWYAWAVNKLLCLLFDKVNEKLGALEKGETQFVHIEAINKQCQKLQELLFQPPYLGKVHHYDDLKKNVCVALNVTEETLGICLNTLRVKRKIGLEFKPNVNELQMHLVKVPCKEDEDVTITETDRAIHNLLVTKMNLEKQLEDLAVEASKYENNASECIKENKRLLAKTFLRKKHLLEKNYERRSLALHNIELLLSNINEAKINGVILEAYKFGSKALQDALEASNLKYDNIDEIVTDVRESIESNKEVQDTLANANFDESLGSFGDEDEFERELEEIMAKSKTTTPQNNISMPMKIEISDAELMDMLSGLEIEESDKKKDVEKIRLGSL